MYRPDLDYFPGILSVGLIAVWVLLGLIGLGLFVLLLVSLGRDAGRRNSNVAGWVILTVFTGFYGLALYLLNRGPIVTPTSES